MDKSKDDNKISKHRKGVIDDRAREIINSVHLFFEKERDETRDVLQAARSALQGARGRSSNRITIPLDLLSEIVSTLQRSVKVVDRASAATGINRRTARYIRTEKEAEASGIVRNKGKKNKPRGGINNLDCFELAALRNMVYTSYIERNEVPKISKLIDSAKLNFNFKGSKSTMRRIMSALGYQFKKTSNKTLVLTERPEIQAWRTRYLRHMIENDSRGPFRKPVIYVDEMTIYSVYGSNTEPKKKTGPGPKRVIIHAGNENGFINGIPLIFNPNAGICQDNITPDMFSRWIQEQLLPSLPPCSLIVMDNDDIHNEEVSKTPGLFSNEKVMADWLDRHNIPHPKCATKSEMYLLIKKHKPPTDYMIDNLLAAHGHQVVRLPPFNNDLNAIEHIWKIVKMRFGASEVKIVEKNIEELAITALQSISPQDWRDAVSHTRLLEAEYWRKDRLMDKIQHVNTGAFNVSNIVENDGNESNEEDIMSD